MSVTREAQLSRLMLQSHSETVYKDRLAVSFERWVWAVIVEKTAWELEAANSEEMEWQATGCVVLWLTVAGRSREAARGPVADESTAVHAYGLDPAGPVASMEARRGSQICSVVEVCSSRAVW